MNIFKTKKSSSKLFGIVPLEYSLDRKNTRCQKLSRTRAFTLIELLVVISIIGFLSSVVLASLLTARTKAVDSKIAQDLRQYQLAVELYYNTNNSYPTAFLNSQNINLADNNNNTTSWINNLSLFTKKAEAQTTPATLCNNFDSIAQKLVTAKLLSKKPVHPKNDPSTGVCYKAFRASDDSYFTAFAPLVGKLSNTFSKRTGFILVKSGTIDSKIATIYSDTKSLGDVRGFPAAGDTNSSSPGSIAQVADEILGVTKGASVAYGGGSGVTDPTPPAPTTYTLTTAVGGYDFQYYGGVITRSPPGPTYNAGESVTLFANPGGAAIGKWIDENGLEVSDPGCWEGYNTCTIQMTSNRTVTVAPAVF
jgi:prepilin-type N-terminal cleavage/methylation domain-containing protein